MADTDFYNRNLFRAYPLMDGPPYVLDQARFSNMALVDFCVVFLSGAGFDPDDDDHVIYPVSATQSAITLSISASGAAVDGLTIVLASPASYEDLSVQSFILSSGGVTYAYGFFVLGRPQELPAAATAISPIAATAFVERRCIQVQRGHYVNKFVLANQPRVCATDRCLDERSSSSAAPRRYQIAPASESLVGDVEFREGYNARIVVQVTTNTIRFNAQRGAGLGEACDEVPCTWDEIALLEAGETLDSALRCNEVLSHINGVEPDSIGGFRLSGGGGIEVSNPAPHTIRLAGRASVEGCATSAETTESSSSAASVPAPSATLSSSSSSSAPCFFAVSGVATFDQDTYTVDFDSDLLDPDGFDYAGWELHDDTTGTWFEADEAIKVDNNTMLISSSSIPNTTDGVRYTRGANPPTYDVGGCVLSDFSSM